MKRKDFRVKLLLFYCRAAFFSPFSSLLSCLDWLSWDNVIPLLVKVFYEFVCVFVCLFVFIFNYERSYIFANHILPFVKITVEDQDCPVSLYFKLNQKKWLQFQNISVTLPHISLKLSEHRRRQLEEKAPVNDVGNKVPMPRNTAASKIDDDAISLLWQLWCHCNLVHNNFLYLSNPAVAVIFLNLCWWQRTLCSNTGGIDPEKKNHRATL